MGEVINKAPDQSWPLSFVFIVEAAHATLWRSTAAAAQASCARSARTGGRSLITPLELFGEEESIRQSLGGPVDLWLQTGFRYLPDKGMINKPSDAPQPNQVCQPPFIG